MGRFTLRLPDSLHQELEEYAGREGVSLNQYIVFALTRQVTSPYTVQMLPPAAVAEQADAFAALLDKLDGQTEL